MRRGTLLLLLSLWLPFGCTGSPEQMTPLDLVRDRVAKRGPIFVTDGPEGVEILINDFELPGELSGIRAVGGATTSIDTGHATHGTRALALAVPANREAGVATRRLAADWSRYAELALDAFNPTTIAAPLIVWLRDGDHRHCSFAARVEPGASTVRVPLALVRPQIDLSGVRELRLLAGPADAPLRFSIDHVRVTQGATPLSSR